MPTVRPLTERSREIATVWNHCERCEACQAHQDTDLERVFILGVTGEEIMARCHSRNGIIRRIGAR